MSAVHPISVPPITTTTTPTIAFEEIGPDEARDLINLNPRNRNLRLGRVEQYARDMRAGNWLPTGEPIQITPDGTLLNGQHRLHAVIEADMMIMFPVMRNVPADYQIVSDAGLNRQFSDILKLQFGESDTVALAAAVRQVHTYRLTGKLGSPALGRTPTHAELIATYEAEVGLGDSIAFGRLVGKAHLATPRGLGAALHYLFAQADPNEAGPYFRLVVSGELLPTDSPIYALRRALDRHDRQPSANGRATHVAALHIKAFNYWREGRSVRAITWHGGGTRDEPFPRILVAEEI